MNRRDRKLRKIVLTESHLVGLRAILQTARKYLAERDYIEQLSDKIENAEVVRPEDLPADQVGIERSVRITDLDRSEPRVYKLVFPRDADYGRKISVIAPLGSALLGRRVGEVVEVCAPARKRKVRIDAVLSGEDHAA